MKHFDWKFTDRDGNPFKHDRLTKNGVRVALVYGDEKVGAAELINGTFHITLENEELEQRYERNELKIRAGYTIDPPLGQGGPYFYDIKQLELIEA